MRIPKNQIPVYRRLLKNDLIKFGYTICRNLVPQKSKCILHKDIADFHHKKPLLSVIISPRGHGKTTWASTISTVHDIAYDTENYILLIKKTYKQAVNDLASIRNVIKYNKTFIAFYGRRVFLTEREDKIIIYNPVTKHKITIEIKGAGMSIRGALIDGARVTKMLLDDFEDENNTHTFDARDKVRSWIAAQVMPCLDPKKGHLLAIGTIVHYDSWLWNIYQNSVKAKDRGEETSWQVVFHEMIENDKAILPEIFTKEHITKLKAAYTEMGQLHKYYQEYFNIPIDPTNADFKREYINYFHGNLEYTNDSLHILHRDNENIPVDVVCGIDPSTGLSEDFTGISILCTSKDGNRYLEMAERKKLKPDELIEELFRIHNTYKPRLFIIEKVGMQVIYEYYLKNEMRRRNIFLRVKGEPVPTRISKEEKLRNALQPIYASGVMHHKNHQTNLEEELVTFPNSKHDDILDSLWLASKYSRKPSFGSVSKRIKGKLKSIKYDWMTGAVKEAA